MGRDESWVEGKKDAIGMGLGDFHEKGFNIAISFFFLSFNFNSS